MEKLAEIWNANIVTMIRNSRQLQIVRFEDLITNPEYAATSIMQRLQTTIAVPEINRITRSIIIRIYTFIKGLRAAYDIASSTSRLSLLQKFFNDLGQVSVFQPLKKL